MIVGSRIDQMPQHLFARPSTGYDRLSSLGVGEHSELPSALSNQSFQTRTEFQHDSLLMLAHPIRYHKSVIRTAATLVLATLLQAQSQLENTGKPMRVPFECTE